MMKNYFRNISALGAIALALVTGDAAAQCNFFAKRAVAALKPYKNTSQVYNTTLLTNDKTQLSMTFYYGDEYRLLIKADEKLGKIQLNLKDGNGKVLFTTKGYGTIQWDFNVEVTQDLTIEVVTPPAIEGPDDDKKETTVLDLSGCVAILVGFK